jgi:hypothetical protein
MFGTYDSFDRLPPVLEPESEWVDTGGGTEIDEDNVEY